MIHPREVSQLFQIIGQLAQTSAMRRIFPLRLVNGPCSLG
jgi:hypothetical protein